MIPWKKSQKMEKKVILENLNIVELIDIYRNYPKINSNNLEESWKNIAKVKLKIKVIKIHQKGMPLDIEKIRAKEALIRLARDF